MIYTSSKLLNRPLKFIVVYDFDVRLCIKTFRIWVRPVWFKIIPIQTFNNKLFFEKLNIVLSISYIL